MQRKFRPQPWCLIVAALMLPAAAAHALDVETLIGQMPAPALRTEYHPMVQRPLQYVGFSFDEGTTQLQAMAALGVNAVGSGAVWFPVQEPEAPYGAGITYVTGPGTIGQSFRVGSPISAIGPILPTSYSTDSGCTWKLYRMVDGEPEDEPIATGRFRDVADNSRPEATFPEQPAGDYLFEISEPVGTWIGWWSRYGDPYTDGTGRMGGEVQAAMDLVFDIRRAGGVWATVVALDPVMTAQKLGPDHQDIAWDLGISFAQTLGNWNNPGFPYYPEWFIDAFPNTIALDSNGNPYLGGIFGDPVPAPGISSGVIVDGTTRFIEQNARRLRGHPGLLYYVLGGEALYATYADPNRWFDYSADELAHFRAWLGAVRYDAIAELNAAWGTGYASFAEATMPQPPLSDSAQWLDFLDFRFAAMAERFGWHYQAARRADPDKLAVSCNHGSIFAESQYSVGGSADYAKRYAYYGWRPEYYAAMTDGWETGQIMADQDPICYNLLYIDTVAGSGKPYLPVRLAYKESNPNARGGGTSFNPPAVRRYGYETLGAGAWHLGYIQFSGSLPDGEWGIGGTPGEAAIEQFMADMKTLSPQLDALHRVRPRVGMFLSHPSWALDGWLPGWQRLHIGAIERQIPRSFLYDDQIRHGMAHDYDVVVSVDNARLDPEVVAALEAYVAAGGRMVIAGAFGTGVPPGLSGPNVTRIDPYTIEQVLDALEPLGRPLAISTAQQALRLSEVQIATTYTDWPQDMYGNDSLGQTLTAPGSSITTISIRTPTYNQVPEQGYTLEVRRGGPGGPLLASREVTGVRDNVWDDIHVGAATTPGETLYVAAIPSPELPPFHIGWWGTTSDVYGDGSAYVDGSPVPGDRHVRILFEELIAGRRAVELFHMSDGLNHGVILINTAQNTLDVSADFGELLAPVLAGEVGYELSVPLRPSAFTGSGLVGSVQIPSWDGVLVYLEAQPGAPRAGDWLAAAEATVEAWKARGAGTPYTADALARARDAMRAGDHAKAAAHALNVRRSLGLKVTAPPWVPRGETRPITIQVLDQAGRPVDADRVWVEFTPTTGFVREAAREHTGLYTLAISDAVVPPEYDYEAQRYERFSGPLRMRVAARLGARNASLLVDTLMTERPRPTENLAGRWGLFR